MAVEFLKIDFGSSLYDQELALRDRLLRKPLGLTFSEEDLRCEGEEHHFGLVENEQLIACVVGKPLSDNAIKLRQMAVDDSLQRSGLGTKLVRHVEQFLMEKGVTRIELSARETAVGFYQRLGYETEGERFIEVSIAHFKMTKRT